LETDCTHHCIGIMSHTILVVDDEKDILDLLKYNLGREGYAVLTATDGRLALEEARKRPNLIVLDVMMPGMDGWEVCRQLKRNEDTAGIPVMFLTAKDTEIDEVVGLELGADDYMVKPISMRKLLARVKSVLRRYEQSQTDGDRNADVIRIDPLEINIPNYTVRLEGKEIVFPRKEFETLVFLAQHPGQVITRERLLNAIWGADVVVGDRTVDVHIRKIREKLGTRGDFVETVKGVGYRFKG
jgi:two-component system, OmpR family, alkaline phosphatase synthesis response regulator PhoP